MTPQSHIASLIRYFPHGYHPGATASKGDAAGVDQYKLTIEKCMDFYEREYRQIRCSACDGAVALPSGEDWEAAWKEHFRV